MNMPIPSPAEVSESGGGKARLCVSGSQVFRVFRVPDFKISALSGFPVQVRSSAAVRRERAFASGAENSYREGLATRRAALSSPKGPSAGEGEDPPVSPPDRFRSDRLGVDEHLDSQIGGHASVVGIQRFSRCSNRQCKLRSWIEGKIATAYKPPLKCLRAGRKSLLARLSTASKAASPGIKLFGWNILVQAREIDF